MRIALVLLAACAPHIRSGEDFAEVMPVSFAQLAGGSVDHPPRGPIAPEVCADLCDLDEASSLALTCSYGELYGSSGVVTDVVVCRGRSKADVVDEDHDLDRVIDKVYKPEPPEDE